MTFVQGAAYQRYEIAFLQGLIGWTCLALILLSAVPFGGVEPFVWALLTIVLLALLAVQLVLDLVTGLPMAVARLAVPGLAIGVAIGWGALQTLPLPGQPALTHPVWELVPAAVPSISADPGAGYQSVVRLVLYCTAFWLIMRSANNRTRAKHFMMAIALWSLALAGFGVYAAATGTNPILAEQDDIVSATFINRNSYATYTIFGLLANMAVFFHLTEIKGRSTTDRRRRLRNFLQRFFSGAWVFFLGILLCLGALFATESRAGAMACFIALVVYFALRAKSAAPGRSVALLAVGAIVFFAFAALSHDVGQRLATTTETAPRFLIYPRIVEAIMDRPWLGHGLGSFEDVFRAYVPVNAARAEWELAHNTYLEHAFELGLPAAALFFAGLLWIFCVLVRSSLRSDRQASAPIVAVAASAGAGAHAVFDFSLQIPAVALLFVALLALGWARAFPRERL